MARTQHYALEVQVRDKVLWIGSDAYPVSNIASAQTRKLVPPKRKSPVGTFVKSLVTWLVLGVAATVIAASTGHGSVTNFIWLAVIAIIIIAIIRLARGLGKRKPDYYALVIETSGSSRTALVTEGREVVDTIIDQIMRAINGEVIRWSQMVNNFYGDTITQLGGQGNTGKIGA